MMGRSFASARRKMFSTVFGVTPMTAAISTQVITAPSCEGAPLRFVLFPVAIVALLLGADCPQRRTLAPAKPGEHQRRES
jgi:hypothetical protein